MCTVVLNQFEVGRLYQTFYSYIGSMVGSAIKHTNVVKRLDVLINHPELVYKHTTHIVFFVKMQLQKVCYNKTTLNSCNKTLHNILICEVWIIFD